MAFNYSIMSFVKEKIQGLLSSLFVKSRYPQTCIKGIPDKNSLTPDKTRCGSHLFHFKKNQDRKDGWDETSINWEDDNTVIEFTFNQIRHDGNKQFKEGVALIYREELDQVARLAFIKNKLAYERNKLKNNKYHGNILLREDVPKHIMKQIAANIALIASENIILREKYETAAE